MAECSTLKYKFVHVLEKTANQNTVSSKDFVLIVQFWNTSTNVVLKFFLAVSHWSSTSDSVTLLNWVQIDQVCQ